VYDIYRCNTTLQIYTTKNLIFWLEFFFSQLFFWLLCLSIRHFRQMFFEFRFTFYPTWNRWYANTEIRRGISQDLAIFNSSHSLQFLFNCYYMFSSSRHCLQSPLNEILKLLRKQHTRQFATRPHTSTFLNNLTGRGSEVSRGGQFWESQRLTGVSVKRSSDNRGSTVVKILLITIRVYYKMFIVNSKANSRMLLC
jgi:hypothetical protein